MREAHTVAFSLDIHYLDLPSSSCFRDELDAAYQKFVNLKAHWLGFSTKISCEDDLKKVKEGLLFSDLFCFTGDHAFFPLLLCLITVYMFPGISKLDCFEVRRRGVYGLPPIQDLTEPGRVSTNWAGWLSQNFEGVISFE